MPINYTCIIIILIDLYIILAKADQTSGHQGPEENGHDETDSGSQGNQLLYTNSNYHKVNFIFKLISCHEHVL